MPSKGGRRRNAAVHHTRSTGGQRNHGQSPFLRWKLQVLPTSSGRRTACSFAAGGGFRATSDWRRNHRSVTQYKDKDGCWTRRMQDRAHHCLFFLSMDHRWSRSCLVVIIRRLILFLIATIIVVITSLPMRERNPPTLEHLLQINVLAGEQGHFLNQGIRAQRFDRLHDAQDTPESILLGEGVGGADALDLVQIALGLPFLLSHPLEYVSRAFNLGRVFIHFWSVNFKFIREDIFVSKEFAVTLLAVHLMFLALFAHFRWCKHEGGLFQFLLSKILELKHRNIFQAFLCDLSSRVLSKQYIATLMFTGNFIGIVCARSLHYQFYSWYFYSLPFLLWKTPFPSYIRLLLFAGVEICWNVYPSNAYSSLLLLTIHLAILCGLWIAPCEPPYQDTDPSAAKED